MNVIKLKSLKGKRPISMVTCYDYSFAKILSKSEIDAILVGDSLSMVIHGHDSTVHATMEMMELHTSAVKRGVKNKFIITDMPFMSYRKSLSDSMNNAERLMKAGANALKLEGLKGNEQVIEHLVDSGVPVMGHLGLTPQSVHQLGGHKVQGKNKKAHERLIDEAKKLEDLGAFSIVVECIPYELGVEVSESVSVPVIGIGAGNGVDGQVLVLNDLLGMDSAFNPKFLRKFLDGENAVLNSVSNFHQVVIDKSFPTLEESF